MESHYILPYIDPVIFAIGPLQIRWYSLAYIFGIIAALLWLGRTNKKEGLMSAKAFDSWLSWAVLSIILGGRLGYVIFYNPLYFLSNPLEILAFWNGGMSFHGGLIGSGIGMYYFCKKYQIDFWKLTDNLAIIAPIGLFFGRIANFINMELYGRFTDSKFGIVFPNAGLYPRHPSQLYEAFLEGIVLFLLLIICRFKSNLYNKSGILTGIFLAGYGSARFIVENFREPDDHLGLVFSFLTMGQLLSLPIILLGIAIIFFTKKK